MTVSVIIPTYNGIHKLPSIIETIKQQTYKKFELVFAVDGSNDGTLNYLQDIKEQFPDCKIISQPNKGRASIRNTGAKASTGELLIFFDDDMLLEPHCLQIHYEHHIKAHNSILTGAQVDLADSTRSDVQRFKNYLSKRWMKYLYVNKPLKKKNLFITAANFSIPRNIFELVNGFDERLKDAEDFDLAVRAFKSGVNLFFNPVALAWHDDKITCASYIKRQREYNLSHRKLIELKPWLTTDEFMKPPLQPKSFKKVVYRLFSNRNWIEAVDNEKLKFLPRNVRYIFYDMIITANAIYFPEKVKL